VTTAQKTCWRFGMASAAGTTLALVGMLTGIIQPGGGVQAQGKPMIDVKLGLWEATTTAESQGVPPIDTSSMTPEQKARVEQYLQAQKGRGNTPTTHTSKSCLTKEKLEKGFLDDARQAQAQCTPTVVSNSATELHMTTVCAAGPGGRGMTADVHFVALSRESVKGEMTMGIGNETGRGMATKATIIAKWLGADCGDVK
jgi:hypothetical protein